LYEKNNNQPAIETTKVLIFVPWPVKEFVYIDGVLAILDRNVV